MLVNWTSRTFTKRHSDFFNTFSQERTKLSHRHSAEPNSVQQKEATEAKTKHTHTSQKW